MKKLVFISLCYFIISFLNLFGTDLRFNKFGTKNGLSSESGYKIIQDNEGFIWIATYDGLDRFDGVNFKSYKPDEKDSTSIPGNMIEDMLIDRNGNLWLATNQGICMYNKNLDCFQRKIKAASLDSSFVKTFMQDKDGNFWCGLGNKAVKISPDYKLIQTITLNPDENESGQNSLVGIKEDAEGILWIVTKEAVFSYNPKIQEKKRYTEFGDITNFYGLNIDSQGNVWVGNYSEPIVYVKKENRFYSVFSPDCPFKLPRSSFASVYDDKKGNLWFSALGTGLFKYNIASESYEIFRYDKNNTFSIASGSIEYTYIDRDGNIWSVGTTCGLSVSYKDNRPFSIMKDVNATQAAIYNSQTTAILEASDGNIWFGTEGQGICVWDPESQTIIKEYRYDANNQKTLGGNTVMALFEDSKGNIWAGGYNAGLSRYNPATDNFTRFRSDNEPPYVVSCMDVRSITEDQDGKIWVVTCCGGVNIYDPITLERQVLTLQNSGILNDYALKIYIDDKKRAWLGTYSGLSIYNISNNSVKNFAENKKVKGSLPDPWVYCVHKDKKGRFWIGTQGGLALFDEKTEKFKIFTEKDGLPSKTIMSITEDNNSMLWIATNNGICKFDPDKETSINYNLDDGLPDIQYRMNAAIIASNGQIYMGSNSGVLTFFPDQINQNQIKPLVFLTELYINNKHIQPQKSKILTSQINYTRKIKLKHNENFLRIEFTALSYFHAEKNTYEYKLEGLDDDWIINGTSNSASYTNLRAGNYTFMVRAYNSDGIQSDIKTIAIRVKPPWYFTKLLILLYILGIGYSIYLYFKRREAQNAQDKLILQQKIDEGRAELDKKIKEVEQHALEIQKRDELEKEIRFQSDGLAKFSDIIAKNRNDIHEFNNIIISELVKYCNASAGAIFMADDTDPENIVLRATSKYCFDTNDNNRFEFKAGEGYIGTCFIKKTTIQIDNLPDNYIVLRSGLGESYLRHSIMIPILNDNLCLGVIELASLDSLEQHVIIFIEKMADTIASVLAISKANEKTQLMLEQNRVQAEELQSQEEELRQNLEEMQATQEDLRRQMATAAKTQEALEEEKVLIDTLLKNAEESIYFKDLQSRFIKLSSSMTKLFNVKSVEELYGKSDFDFFTEEHARPAFEDEMKIIKTGKPILNKIEKETHADGRITYVNTSKMPLRNTKGEIIGTFGISKDVTELVNMEMNIKQRNEELQAQDEELRQNLEEMQTVQENLELQIAENKKIHEETLAANQKLELENIMFTTLMDNIAARITFKDTDARYIRINKVKKDALGLTDQSEVMGKTDLEVFVDTHTPDKLKKEIEQIRAGVSSLNIEEYIKQKNGFSAWGDTNRIPLKNKDGEIIGGLVVTWDITDKKNTQARLEQVNTILKSFSDSLPVILFNSDEKGNLMEISGHGLEIIGTKNKPVDSKRLSELFPDIKKAIVDKKDKDVYDFTGNIKINNTTIKYKALLLKNIVSIGGYSGYIHFE